MKTLLLILWLLAQPVPTEPMPNLPEPLHPDAILSDHDMICMQHECEWIQEVEPRDL